MAILISQNIICNLHGIIGLWVLAFYIGKFIFLPVCTIHLKRFPGDDGTLFRSKYLAFYNLFSGILYFILVFFICKSF